MSEGIDTKQFQYGGDRAESLEDFILQLQDLVLDSHDVREFLTDMAAILSDRLSHSENAISCGITVFGTNAPQRWPPAIPGPGAWTNCRTASATDRA